MKENILRFRKYFIVLIAFDGLKFFNIRKGKWRGIRRELEKKILFCKKVVVHKYEGVIQLLNISTLGLFNKAISQANPEKSKAWNNDTGQ